MTSFENMYDIEGAMERAGIQLLGEKAAAYHEFSDANKRTPGYEVQFDNTGATGQYKRWRGLQLEREWRGVLKIRIVTRRFKNSDEHLPMLVHARMQFTQWFLLLTPAVLPYHEVTFLRSLPITRGHVEEQLHDWTELPFDTVVSARDDAWPAE